MFPLALRTGPSVPFASSVVPETISSHLTGERNLMIAGIQKQVTWVPSLACGSEQLTATTRSVTRDIDESWSEACRRSSGLGSSKISRRVIPESEKIGGEVAQGGGAGRKHWSHGTTLVSFQDDDRQGLV